MFIAQALNAIWVAVIGLAILILCGIGVIGAQIALWVHEAAPRR